MPDEAITLIYGINHRSFDYKKHQLVSAASCTTTGLAHMVKPLLENEETSKISLRHVNVQRNQLTERS
jgi:glyceraldehyde 3-phosphate dehydrogenase